MKILILLFLGITINSLGNIRKLENVYQVNMPVIKEQLAIPISLGTPRQEFLVTLDTASYHLWLGNVTLSKQFIRVFDTPASMSVEITNNYNVAGTKEKGNEVLDILELDGKSTTMKKKFHFLLLNKLERGYVIGGVLGISRNYVGKIKYSSKLNVDANPRFNILQFLQTNKLIDEKTFSIKFTSDESALLTIGEHYESSPFQTCSPNELAKEKGFYNDWNCAYDGVAFTNQTYITHFEEGKQKSVRFETALNIIQLPEEEAYTIFLAIAYETKENCKKKLVKGKGIGMYCGPNLDFKKVPDLLIKIHGFDFKLLGKEIFEPHYDEENNEFGYISKIYGSKYNKNLLRLGLPFLKYYHMIFNQDNGTVGIGEFNDIFTNQNTENKDKKPHFNRPRRGLSILEIFGIISLISIVCFGIYYIVRRVQSKKKMIKLSSSEVLINPIGKPMINKK